MNRREIVSAAIVCLAAALPARATTLRCPPDSVKVGNACIDTYEASVWQIDPANTTLVRKVQTGRACLADLTAGGATLVSSSSCNLRASRPTSADGELDGGRGIEPAVAGRLRRFHSRRAPEQVHHLVPGEPGVPAVGEAAADQSRMARRGRRHARPAGRRRDHVRDQFRRARRHRLARELQIRLGRVRHGRQRERVGRRLG